MVQLDSGLGLPAAPSVVDGQSALQAPDQTVSASSSPCDPGTLIEALPHVGGTDILGLFVFGLCHNRHVHPAPAC